MATIHHAARNGNLNRVKAFLNQGVPVNSRNEAGWTPLLAAFKHPRIVHALIKAGANPKYRNMYGRDPSTYPRNDGNAFKTSRAATKFQNFRKKSIARKRAPNKNLAEKVFSPKRVRAMTAKYGNNWLNKV